MEWISVKERLPEKGQRVLVTDGKNICLHYKQSCLNWDDEMGYDLYCSCPTNYDQCDFREGDITHWMSLPPIPGEKNDEVLKGEYGNSFCVQDDVRQM